jgi:hypothetical protein
MTLQELAGIASGLPLGARDMRDDIDRHFAALNSYAGKLSVALEPLANTGAADKAVSLGEAVTYCGASLLVIASIAAGSQDIQEG